MQPQEPSGTVVDPLSLGWKQIVERGGFEGLIGPLWFKKAADGARFAFQADERHANPNGVVHGGMLMTMIDHAMGAIVWHAIGEKPCATVSLHCDFVAGARPGDWIECAATITRHGRGLMFVRGELSVAGQPVMTADGIWKIIGAE